MAGLDDGAALFLGEAGGHDLVVSRETRERLEILVRNLRRWQKAINLVARATLDDVWIRHILDSAQLVPFLPANSRQVVDLGSGAGFPGLVIAAFRPDLSVCLVESDARKSVFLSETARSMGIATTSRVMTGRIEATAPLRADIVTARAVASLPQLLAWAFGHRSDTAICLFHKGKGWRDELAEAKKTWDIPCEPFTSWTDRDAVILRIGPYSVADLRYRQPEGWRRQDDHGD